MEKKQDKTNTSSLIYISLCLTPLPHATKHLQICLYFPIRNASPSAFCSAMPHKFPCSDGSWRMESRIIGNSAFWTHSHCGNPIKCVFRAPTCSYHSLDYLYKCEHSCGLCHLLSRRFGRKMENDCRNLRDFIRTLSPYNCRHNCCNLMALDNGHCLAISFFPPFICHFCLFPFMEKSIRTDFRFI